MGSESLIFVDLGAYDGRSVRAFERVRNVERAYLWEPNEFMNPGHTSCQSHIIRAAAWVEDGKQPMYLSTPPCGKGKGQGSTLIKEKTTGYLEYGHPVMTETRDFAEWLDGFSGQDIVVKMNVEGAEYQIIEHLAAQSVLDVPIEWYISWHDWKIGRSEEDTEDMRDILRYFGYREIGGEPFPVPEFEGWIRGDTV